MIKSYAVSLPGERAENEDSVLTAEAEGALCFVLCDGLGGHAKGAEASKCVCNAMEAAFLKNAHLPLSSRMSRSIDWAEDCLESMPPPRGKTTLCCLMMENDGFCGAWVGDSRIYMFRNGRIVGRTLDHSVPQHLVRMGEITEAQIRRHPDRNRLLRAMGGGWDGPEYELWPLSEGAKAGDAFLLCSDGFWDWVEDEEMVKTLKSASSPKDWVEQMRLIAEKRGAGTGMDNLSAIGVWVEG